jgi:homoserine kinase type II
MSAPMALQDGSFLTEVCGKPAVIVTRLPGVPHLAPTPEQCRKVGRILADIHEAGLEYDAGLANWRGQAWREGFAQRVRPKITADEAALIESENRYQALHDDTVLPQGVIHGDLFRDNVLWDEGGEGGVIDFYFACDDALLYDVAITVNDWCTDAFACLDPERTEALLAGYDAHRPLTDLERELWPVMLRRAALRTWLGRLEYNHFPKASEMTIPKDHAYSRRLLEHHIVHARALEAAGD